MTHPLILTSLPLFPLNTVLFPDGALALRVFEVRYLHMVRKCHETGAPFGVVSLHSGDEVRRAGAPHEQFHNVGTLATIQQLEAPQPALLHVHGHGGARFRIARQTLLPHGLWIADVTQIAPDRPIPIPDDLAPVSVALAQLLATLHLRDPTSPSAILPSSAQLDDSGWVANRWCELLPVPPELKQQLMELENPLVRLELVGDILDRTGIAPT